MYETILLPTDGSAHTDVVAEHAVDVARRRDATVRVLSVVDDRAFLVLDDDRIDAVREDLRANARDAVAAAAAAADGRVAVETAIREGDPAERILEYADDAGVDLIVMGTSGDRYERNVVGSVSQRVVRASPVPVLTVGPDDTD